MLGALDGDAREAQAEFGQPAHRLLQARARQAPEHAVPERDDGRAAQATGEKLRLAHDIARNQVAERPAAGAVRGRAQAAVDEDEHVAAGIALAHQHLAARDGQPLDLRGDPIDHRGVGRFEKRRQDAQQAVAALAGEHARRQSPQQFGRVARRLLEHLRGHARQQRGLGRAQRRRAHASGQELHLAHDFGRAHRPAHFGRSGVAAGRRAHHVERARDQEIQARVTLARPGQHLARSERHPFGRGFEQRLQGGAALHGRKRVAQLLHRVGAGRCASRRHLRQHKRAVVSMGALVYIPARRPWE